MSRWRPGSTVPGGYVLCTPERARACADAGVHVVVWENTVGTVHASSARAAAGAEGTRTWVPSRAANALEGTTRSMLRNARRDPVARAALVAAAALAKAATPRVTAGIIELDDAVLSGFKPGELASQFAARPWARR